jgi:hypothetical protein
MREVVETTDTLVMVIAAMPEMVPNLLRDHVPNGYACTPPRRCSPQPTILAPTSALG